MQGNYIEDYFLIGGIAVIGLAEIAHLGAMLSGQSFSGCVMLFGILLGVFAFVVMVGAGAWSCYKRKKCNSRGKANDREQPEVDSAALTVNQGMKLTKTVWIGFFLVVVLQIALILLKEEVYLGGDLTAETVESLLTTDAFYQVNPMTGQAYALGVPSRLKILCLPTLYGIICEVFNLSAELVVWKIIPVIVLLGSYLAYHILAKVFWDENALARGIFMVVVALCFLLGDYMYGVDGFAVMHCGYRGVSIRAAVLLPYTFGLCLRRKWLLALLCVLAEACMVWTLYGMGACLFVIVGMYVVTAVLKRAGKGGLLCKNS